MPSALSVDLRERVVAAMAAGASCHGAAARFGVSVSSASRWAGRVRQDGRVAPSPRGGDQRSQAIEAHADLIRATYEARPTICLHELRDALAERGVATSTSGLSRFFARHRITRKRMARPVRKWLGSAGLSSLHKRIRPSGRPLAKMEIRASQAS